MDVMYYLHVLYNLLVIHVEDFLLVLQDKLMTAPVTEGSSGGWLFKNKEHGKASAAASLVMITFTLCLS